MKEIINKKINNFIKYNKILLKPIKSNTNYIAVADREKASQSILQSILISAYCNKFQYKPIIVTDGINIKSKKIFQSFGFFF